MSTKKHIILLFLILLAVAVLALAPFFGMQSISLKTALILTDDVKSDIFWKIRLPRIIVAFLAGAALGIPWQRPSLWVFQVGLRLVRQCI